MKKTRHSTREKTIVTLTILIITIPLAHCKKIVDIPPPQTEVTAPAIFSSDKLANAAVVDIYSNLINQGINFSNFSATLLGGLSADELIPQDQIVEDLYVQFQNNNIQLTNGLPYSYLWSPAYSAIYKANAVIEGLTTYTGVQDSLRNVFLGEAKFLRALCYFYLANFFGNAPLVLSTNFNKTTPLPCSNQDQISGQVKQDLADAQSLLADAYDPTKAVRIRAIKYAATALLARQYLYLKQWDSAEAQSTKVINCPLYQLENDLTKVFNINSTEAILQLQQSANLAPVYNGTMEGLNFIPTNSSADYPPDVVSSYPSYFIPNFYLTQQLINSFEPGDLRFSSWANSNTVDGKPYYYPYKYTTGPSQVGPSQSVSQYYMVLRLAEQYLIRAEARAQRNDLTGALSDLNILRQRASLVPLADTLTSSQILQQISEENRHEFFCEWGHRWLDLKRTSQAISILDTVKLSPIEPNSLLYPIPVSEIKTDPNLKQNPGY